MKLCVGACPSIFSGATARNGRRSTGSPTRPPRQGATRGRAGCVSTVTLRSHTPSCCFGTARLMCSKPASARATGCLLAMEFLRTPAPVEVSVSFSRAGLVAHLCRCAANLWEGTRDVLSAVPNRWQRAAAEMDRIEASMPPPKTPANARVRLIFDRDHQWALREWLRVAKQRTTGDIAPIGACRYDAPACG